MRISSKTQNLSFKRALREDEISGYSDTLKKAKQCVGQTGKSIFIVHDACLPQRPEINTGVGNLSSVDSCKFFETMKTYLGVNTVEVLPLGPIKPVKNLYCAYGSSALPLSSHLINPELLLDESFEKLLKTDEIKNVVEKNDIPEKMTRTNYSNVVDDGSPFDNMLKKAFERFKKLDEHNQLRQKFDVFVKENDDWLEPLSKVQNGIDREFFKFKQFLAEEHLKIAKNNLNKLGLQLCVDCEIGFSPQEVAAFPNAFLKDTKIGVPSWNLPALKYNEILNPESDAYKLLKRKVQLNAKRGDIIRFDASWSYVSPKLTNLEGHSEIWEMGDAVLKNIENWVKEIKGQDYDLKNLLHEFEANPLDFRAMVNDRELIPPLKGRTKVYSSTYMSDNWGNNDAFINYRNFAPDEYVLGVGNHDPQPLRQIANEIPDIVTENGVKVEKRYKYQQIEPLSRILKISKEILSNPVEFAKAKYAEAMMAKNTMVFYMDVFGRADRFDMQDYNNPLAYSHKIPIDYEKAYIDALKEGYGFNPMDALEKIFKAKGLDQSNPDLYAKIVKYRDILVKDDEIIEQSAELPKRKLGRINKKGLIFLSTVSLFCVLLYICTKLKNKVKMQKNTNALNQSLKMQSGIGVSSAFSDFKI